MGDQGMITIHWDYPYEYQRLREVPDLWKIPIEIVLLRVMGDHPQLCGTSPQFFIRTKCYLRGKENYKRVHHRPVLRENTPHISYWCW